MVAAAVLVAALTLGRVRLRAPRAVRLADDAESLARRKRREERDTEDKAHADRLVAEPVEVARDDESGIDFLRRMSRSRDE